MLVRFIDLINDLVVYPENMKKNLDRLKGLVFSQRVLLELIFRGVKREESYKIVQRAAMKVWKGKADFKTLLLRDKEVLEHLKPREVERCFDLKPYLKNVDYIFKRVFKT
jgi:adenylosuccinate lyase